MAIPQFQDVELKPAVFRRVRAKTPVGNRESGVLYELMLSAKAVEKAVGTLAYDLVPTLFAEAAGVMIDDTLLEVLWIASAEAFGSVYLYRVGLRGALKDVA